MERHNGPPSTHPLLADERVDLRDGDNLRHEHTQPLGVEEVELTQLGLEVTVVEEHPTLMQKSDCLRGEWTISKDQLITIRVVIISKHIVTRVQAGVC